MRSELSKRIAKLEGRGFSPAELRLAYRNFVEHNIEPRNPKLMQVILDIKNFLEATELNAMGLDHEQHQNPA